MWIHVQTRFFALTSATLHTAAKFNLQFEGAGEHLFKDAPVRIIENVRSRAHDSPLRLPERKVLAKIGKSREIIQTVCMCVGKTIIDINCSIKLCGRLSRKITMAVVHRRLRITE